MSGLFCMLSIEIDGHFHGSPDVPRPWVARIDGTSAKWGLAREFVQPMNDWAEAKAAMSGNIYGRVARFALRDGNVYEVSRLRGSSSKRHVAREFLAIVGGKRTALSPLDALERVDGGGGAGIIKIPEDRDGTSWVASVRGLGTPTRLGFVVEKGIRWYRVRDGLYEVVERERRSFVLVQDLRVKRLTEQEAFACLSSAVA